MIDDARQMLAYIELTTQGVPTEGAWQLEIVTIIRDAIERCQKLRQADAAALGMFETTRPN